MDEGVGSRHRVLEEAEETEGLRALLPGLLVTALAALAAAYLSEHYGAPLTLMSLLIGLALNFLNSDPRLTPGLTFASRTLLRIGIVLVGAQVTVGEMLDLGPLALLGIVSILGGTLLFGALAGRALGYGAAFGTLAGGAVAICGASAALALATVLGDRRIDKAQLTLVLVGVSVMSSLAMFLYPILSAQMGLDDRQAGFLIGASIHDVAQALGAGYAVSEPAGETAAIVKLARVAMLAPILLLVAACFRRRPEDRRGIVPLPWFLLGFFLLAILNSLGAIPPQAGEWAGMATTACLACAVTATGILSPMNVLLQQGLRPLLVIVLASLVALAGAAAVAVAVL